MTTSQNLTRILYLCLLAALVVLLAATGASAELQIVWGPVLGDLTPTSAQATWYTNVPALGGVEIGGQTVAWGGPVQAHHVLLRGLEPDRTYTYRLSVQTGAEKATSRWYHFTTPGPDLTTFTFCAYGDTRSDPAAHREVVGAMVQCKPRLVLHSGDLVSDGGALDGWKHFFPVIARFSPSVPLYPCLGNHENNADLYYQLLPLPAGYSSHQREWYTVTFGSCQFIVLDSCRAQAEQSEWLQALLAKPRPPGVVWRIAMFHHPPYASGPHPPDADALKYFCPYLENGGVDLVFNGHNHYYERSLKGRLNYVTVGGGGAPLYDHPALPNPYRQSLHVVLSFAKVEVTPEALQVTALDTKLQTLDSFTVTH